MKKVLMIILSILFLSPAFGRDIKAQEYDKLNMEISRQYFMMRWHLNQIEPLKGTENYIIEYNRITQYYHDLYGLDLAETIYDVFDQNEIQMIAEVVEAETHDAPFAAKVNVASVIFNRYHYDDGTCNFPDELEDILNQKNQFASGRPDVSHETIHAVEYAYTIGDTTGGALWFNKAGINSWAKRNREELFTDEVGHSFYK